MFGKHFERMYQGSMRGAGADVFAVWGYAISHARPDSLVEMNSEIVAFLIGMPQQRVEKALEFLQSPDPKSRNKEYEGRRMVKRGEFEYFLPSLAYYRGVKSLEDLREYNRVKQRESRERRKGFVETEESETEVEPHDGFPRTKEDAVAHSDFVGCTKEFAETTWNKAMSRSGRDSKGQVIRSWRHFLASEHAYHKGRPDINGNQKRSPEWDKTIREP